MPQLSGFSYPVARDAPQYPYRNGEKDVSRFRSIVAVQSGGTVSPTGAVGVPSGAYIYTKYRPAGASVIRLGVGNYRFMFSPSPSGSIQAWIDVDANSSMRTDGQVTAKNMQTGFAEFKFYNVSGVVADPATGSAIRFDLCSVTTGEPNAS